MSRPGHNQSHGTNRNPSLSRPCLRPSRCTCCGGGASRSRSRSSDIAAVLLRFSDGDPRDADRTHQENGAIVQQCGAALLTDGHPDLVARGGADGAHLSGIQAMQGALPSLKPQRIPASAASAAAMTRCSRAKPERITSCSVILPMADALRSRRSPSGSMVGEAVRNPLRWLCSLDRRRGDDRRRRSGLCDRRGRGLERPAGCDGSVDGRKPGDRAGSQHDRCQPNRDSAGMIALRLLAIPAIWFGLIAVACVAERRAVSLRTHRAKQPPPASSKEPATAAKSAPAAKAPPKSQTALPPAPSDGNADLFTVRSSAAPI